jgi:hypothetical protein
MHMQGLLVIMLCWWIDRYGLLRRSVCRLCVRLLYAGCAALAQQSLVQSKLLVTGTERSVYFQRVLS